MCIYSIAVDGGRASVINVLARSFGVFKRILLAYDGSQHAKKALEVAVDLAKKYGARLYIVEVIDTATAFWGPGTHVPFDAIESMRRKAEADIAEAKARAESEGIQVKPAILEGDPAVVVVEYADREGVDLIVAGSRGLSTMKRVLLGSVSTGIVTHAKRPVLIVK
jgi:nucleotide-binding universal stress UspA family protein